MGPRQKFPIKVTFKANREGEFSDICIPCLIGGMDAPLVLCLAADVKGLTVEYFTLKEDGRFVTCVIFKNVEQSEAKILCPYDLRRIYFENIQSAL